MEKLDLNEKLVVRGTGLEARYLGKIKSLDGRDYVFAYATAISGANHEKVVTRQCNGRYGSFEAYNDIINEPVKHVGRMAWHVVYTDSSESAAYSSKREAIEKANVSGNKRIIPLVVIMKIRDGVNMLIDLSVVHEFIPDPVYAFGWGTLKLELDND